LAASKVELYSEAGKICEATPITDVNPTTSTATITAQCNPNVSDYWISAVITSPDNILLITVTLDSPVEVRAGETVILTITLAWS
jgi:hypothetical protein